jgi:protein SCO1/2
MKTAVGFLSVLILAGLVRGDSSDLPSILQEVGIDQHLEAQVPLDLEFRQEDVQAIRLRDCMANKPTILIMAYYRCPMLCTQVLNGLVDGLRKVPFEMGKDYQVVTVSFDDREGPELAAAKKRSYLEQYGRPGAARGWYFLTGSRPAIATLAETVGFRFRYDPKQDQFAHASGIMILTPAGKISRYFYGIQFPPRDLRLGLVEASANKIGSPVDQLLLFCYHYDSSTGKYTAAVMQVVRTAGALTLLVLGGFLLVAWLHDARRRQKQAHAAVANLTSNGPGPMH